ncbi:unnamed protein product [Rotaria sordida]|uniref:Uncharacterized protein n=1 Tax=Rotaria sordida TaxID=392033 RepID=A0A813Q066_9BILA|nr:unnamed protein product [Rotaria sordida]CAF0758691.1 unnamed protein product [Rotaria sordida]CAF0787099.1 unnamed protein product [Rotaria sordida]CAF0815512.1 unnamed protein product [Rotaria sordida]CAF0816769.1 unnamed protein product [Rotaria sordida]
MMIILIMMIFCWKRIFRNRSPVFPYKNSSVAFITQAYRQQGPYRTVWASPQISQLPPPYYSVTNNATIPPSVFYTKQ